MDKKRILIAVGFLALCIGLGYLIYRIFFKSSFTTEIPRDQFATSTPGEFPQAGEGRPLGTGISPTTTLPSGGSRPISGQPTTETPGAVTRIVSDSIEGVSGAKAGMRYYNTQDGKFYRIGPDGKPIPLDDTVFFNVQSVSWAPQKNEAIIEYPDQSNIYYNFETRRQVSLPRHWEEFSFSPSSDKIAAKSMGISSDGNWLISASPDGQNVKLIEAMGDNSNRVDVNWSPNQQIIATSRTGDALGADQEEILFVGQNKENFKSITVEGRGLTSEWSPTGGKLLYSVYSDRSDYKPELWITNSQPGNAGTERKLLNVNTWADKCAFQDDRYVYCGIPQSLERGAGFVPDIANNIPDNIYKIDTQTGAKTEIPMSEDHVVESMFLGDDGQTLYFTDKNQSGLFRVSP